MKSKKIEVMVVSPSNECPHINIFNKRNKLKQRNQFQILFTLISSDGFTEIASFQQLLPCKHDAALVF